MSKNFNYQPDELFGRYCLIEQKRYGVPNEKFLHKVINTLNSNAWSNVPVDNCDKEIKLHDHCEQVVNVICCGVSEDKVERYRLCDVELLPSKLQSQLDQQNSKIVEEMNLSEERRKIIEKLTIELNEQKAMWNELKEWLKNQITDLRHIDIKTETQSLRVNDAVNCFRQVLNQIIELEVEDE